MRLGIGVRHDEHAGMKTDFSDLLDALAGLVWTTDAEGRSDFANRGWCEYTGLDLDGSLGHGWLTAIHSDDRTSFQEAWNGLRQAGAGNEIDVRLRRSDGEYRWFVFRPTPLPEDSSRQQRWCWLGLNADEGTTTDGRTGRLCDMLPIRVGFLDTAGTLDFNNLQSRDRDYSTSMEKLREWTTSGIIHADDHERNHAGLKALLTTGKPYDNELRMLRPDGVYRWARARAVPVRDAQGNIVRYVSFSVDIDDLKRAEALLAAEVRLLEMVARGEPLDMVLGALCRHVEELCSGCFCGALVVAPDRKHFKVGAGPSMPEAFKIFFDGRSIDDDHGPSSLSVIEKAPILVADLANDPRWQASVWQSLMKTVGYASSYSMPVISSSGEASGVLAVYRRDKAAPTKQEQELVSRFTKIAGIAIDRAQADAALHASEQELRETVAQLIEGQRLTKTGSFTADVRQDRYRWSDEFYRIFEIDPETPPHLGAVRARIHPEDLQLFDAEMQLRIEGSGSDFDFRVVTPNGGLKHFRGVAQIIEHLGDEPVFMGTVQDITDGKLAEEALNRTRSELAHVARVATLNAMTASIAHEVSQPIFGILTNANTCVRMLAADPPNLTGAAETTRRTIRDANRASEVIKRLRAMFSAKASVMEIADFNEVVNEVIALSMSELRRNNASLQTDFADDLPRVSVDRVQLQQVILNLLLNAADAMAGIEDRPRTILVQTGLDDNNRIRLNVRDSGTGFDPNSVEKLFSAFYTTKEKGMGVGLSISRSIIEKHKGRLWAEVNQGPGATFSFYIPGAGNGGA